MPWQSTDPLKRLLSRVKPNPESGCWEYQGAVSEYGYGRISVDGRLTMTHRLAYERLVGPIPDGFEIDHLCRNRACCLPEHLEPVTQHENILRGEGACAVNARKTHCIPGHEFTPENTITRPGGRGCRLCAAARRSRR